MRDTLLGHLLRQGFRGAVGRRGGSSRFEEPDGIGFEFDCYNLIVCSMVFGLVRASEHFALHQDVSALRELSGRSREGSL
jgi:hypothetical protein